MEQLGHELVPMWDASSAGSSFAHYIIMPVPENSNSNENNLSLLVAAGNGGRRCYGSCNRKVKEWRKD